ncbi:hypothetical protein O9G_006229, partial [Rozella allomycis CSF55]
RGLDLVILGVYVDDILIAEETKERVEDVVEYIKTKYKIDLLGEINWFLGIGIERDGNELRMSQKSAIEGILKRFNMEDANEYTIPVEPKKVYSKCDSPVIGSPEHQEMKDVPYRQAVGSLIYLAKCTRPDIAYAVSLASRFLSNPGKKTVRLEFG